MERSLYTSHFYERFRVDRIFLSRAYDVYMYVLIISSENNLFISSYNYIEIGITGLI